MSALMKVLEREDLPLLTPNDAKNGTRFAAAQSEFGRTLILNKGYDAHFQEILQWGGLTQDAKMSRAELTKVEKLAKPVSDTSAMDWDRAAVMEGIFDVYTGHVYTSQLENVFNAAFIPWLDRFIVKEPPKKFPMKQWRNINAANYNEPPTQTIVIADLTDEFAMTCINRCNAIAEERSKTTLSKRHLFWIQLDPRTREKRGRATNLLTDEQIVAGDKELTEQYINFKEVKMQSEWFAAREADADARVATCPPPPPPAPSVPPTTQRQTIIDGDSGSIKPAIDYEKLTISVVEREPASSGSPVLGGDQSAGLIYDNSDSDNDSDNEEEQGGTAIASDGSTPPAASSAQKAVWCEELRTALKLWSKLVSKTDWMTYLPPSVCKKVPTTVDGKPSFHRYYHLVRADMGKLLWKLEMGTKHGVLPQLAFCHLAGCTSSCYTERMNSCAKDIMSLERTRLSNPYMDVAVYLRMNKEFVRFCRGRFPEEFRKTLAPDLAALATALP
jgi:hypothetical protein